MFVTNNQQQGGQMEVWYPTDGKRFTSHLTKKEKEAEFQAKVDRALAQVADILAKPEIQQIVEG
jgi:hypothetical protein